MGMLMGGFFSQSSGPAPTPQVAALTDPLNKGLAPPGGNRPIVAVKFKTNGDIEEAIGDTGSALNFSKVGEWLDSVPPDDSSDWELNWDVISIDPGGSWLGSTTDSFFALSADKTFQWEKDVNDASSEASVVTCILRQVSDTGNSTTRANLDYTVTINA